jgi:hypothetical protein
MWILKQDLRCLLLIILRREDIAAAMDADTVLFKIYCFGLWKGTGRYYISRFRDKFWQSLFPWNTLKNGGNGGEKVAILS